MHITLSNFGPIDSFSLDLKKDFHLLVGDNNVGKSYAITAVYLIVKSMLDLPFRRNMPFFGHGSYVFGNVLSDGFFEESIGRINEALKEDTKKDFDVIDAFSSDIAGMLTKLFVPQLSSSFENTFTSIQALDNQLSGGEFEIKISTDNIDLLIGRKDKGLQIKKVNIKHGVLVRRVKVNRNPSLNNGRYVIYYSDESRFESTYTGAVLSYCIDFLSDVSSVISNIHYLPAGRSGLYQALSAFGQIIAELSRNRSFLSRKIELPGIPETVSDYFIKLSDIRVVKRSYENTKINEIAKSLEDGILKGRVDFNPQSKQLMYYPHGSNLQLELSSTSSMVSELAPIVSYLRYVLTAPAAKTSGQRRRVPRQLIMIEEPEAHLHPEVQLKLAEIFASLLNVGVKLVITSHSNFIFNKINNLIMGGSVDPQVVQSLVFKNGLKGSVAIPLEVDDLGIADCNFSKAIDDLFDEKIEIIDRLNSVANVGIGAGHD